MASSSNPMPNLFGSHHGTSVSEKLTRDNYMLWKAQVLPTVRGARVLGNFDGSEAAPSKTMEIQKADKTKEIVDNPAHGEWMAKDQQLMSFLLNSITKEVLPQVSTMETSAQVWETLETMFSAQSRARVTNLRLQLANMKKGRMTVAAYFTKMKAIRDEIVMAGKAMEDDEIVAFILNGLDFDYNPVVSSVMSRTDPITVSELYAQLVAFDMGLEMLQENHSGGQSSVNSASRGRGRGNYRGRGNGRGNGRGQGRGNSQGSGGGFHSSNKQTSSNSNTNKVVCQICKKGGHEATDCWYRYDEDYQQKTAGSASAGYGVDTNWYADSGASDHITSELEWLTVRDKYCGHDQVHTAGGSGSNNEENPASR